jgi:hypothetical protein
MCSVSTSKVVDHILLIGLHLKCARFINLPRQESPVFSPGGGMPSPCLGAWVVRHFRFVLLRKKRERGAEALGLARERQFAPEVP